MYVRTRRDERRRVRKTGVTAMSTKPPALISRRSSLASIGVVPLVAVVGCGSDDGGEAPPRELTPEERHAALVAEFEDAFNAHDLERALAFFAESAVLTVNQRVFEGRDAIRSFLVEYGATTEGAALGFARMNSDISFFTGDALLVEGRISGRQDAEISGFAATGAYANINYALFFRFDETDRCTSCEGVLNWGALLPIPIA
jgi:ketosteroid isomerase-like protein